MGDNSLEKKSGCGILSVFFCGWPKKSTSDDSIPSTNKKGGAQAAPPMPKRRHDDSDEPVTSSSKQADKVIPRPGPNHQRVAPTQQQFQNHNQIKTTNTSQKPNKTQGYYGKERKLPYGSTGISGELDSLINDHHRSFLGNMKQGPAASNAGTETPISKNAPNNAQKVEIIGGPPCRALSIRKDPEELMNLGDEDYKNGNFEEALSLYDAAISINPKKASYRINRSKALEAIGRLLEAIFECREAIRIEPRYQRAHNHLAALYVRLGEAEKAMYHHKLAGEEADPEVLTKAKNLRIHLNKCTEAKTNRNLIMLLKETELAILAGADSAPQIFALRAEALLKMRRHADADETLARGPNFDVDDCTKFFGPLGNANILIIRAQVDMAAGMFEKAVESVQRAARLNGTNKEVNTVFKRTRALASAQSNGNDLFQAQNYTEACIVYGEGLDHDPYNAALLCNRAACELELSQYEKAIDDCNFALNLQPSYKKARLLRANCYAKLKKWEACIQDYEVMLGENPGDVEVRQALKDAKLQLHNRQR